MSKETLTWLRNNVRVGFTSEDGPAWWAADNSMADGSHFSGPVPTEEARKILAVPLVEGTMETIYSYSGQTHRATDSERKTVVNAETGDILGVFKDGYNIHAYEEWTLNQLSALTDMGTEDLAIKSVGRLRKGGQVWLQIRMTQDFEVNGFGYTPFITAATSADGTLSSTYITGIDAAVCDNTLSAALLNANTKVKIKHSKKSAGRISEVRERLGLVFTLADGFNRAATELMETPITEGEWEQWLNLVAPIPEAKEGARGTRGVTMAENKRSSLSDLYYSDAKVAPWKGTAFGPVQAWNTFQTWEGQVRGADGGRMERFFGNMVTGKTEESDAFALKSLSAVLGKELLAA